MEKIAFGFDRDGDRPLMAVHCFTAKNGLLVHSIDGNVRTVVPPEGWSDYEEAHPDAREVIAKLRMGSKSKPKPKK